MVLCQQSQSGFPRALVGRTLIGTRPEVLLCELQIQCCFHAFLEATVSTSVISWLSEIFQAENRETLPPAASRVI